MQAAAPILMCLAVGALGCGGSSGSQGSAVRVCQLEDLRVSTRAQGATGTIVGSIRLRNPDDACSIATRAGVSLRNAGGHRLAVRVRAPQRASATRQVRLDGPGSNDTAVVSLDWKEWCRDEPGETTVTLRIPGSGELTGLRVFDGSHPSCIFEDRQKSVLNVSHVSLITLTEQELD
jgi:Protein of unknown function (DUF4232)